MFMRLFLNKLNFYFGIFVLCLLLCYLLLIDINECLVFLCVNGNCFNILGFYICICDVGWIGINCS